MLITEPISMHARHHPFKPAVVSGEAALTYKELYQSSYEVSQVLRAYQRTRPEDLEYKIAILLPNTIEFLQVFLGAAAAGWIAAPFDVKWSAKELQSTLAECEPQLLIVDETFVRFFPSVPSSTRIITINRHDGLSKWLNKPGDEPPVQHLPQDSEPFYMGFTSGTTGKPKAFIRSHRSWVTSFAGSQAEFGIDSDDHVLVPGPLVHSHFLYASVQAIFTGATVYLLDKFSPVKWIDLTQLYPITMVYMVPTMFEALFSTFEEGQTQISTTCQIRAFLSSGAKWSPASKHKISYWFPEAQLFEFYGASELSFVTVLDPEGNRLKPDSVGRTFHGVNLSIRREDGTEAAVNEVGKLFVQSDMVFSGYYRNEEETSRILQKDGWATVDDLAKRDEDGYIYLVGREKNMIIYGGLNVYPEEVEKAIRQFPSVEEVVVLGIPDEYWGEKIIAVIVLKQGMDVKPRELQIYCREHVSAYKCPREFILMESLPYTTSGKVARSRLKKLVTERIK
jgi:long-chain acyl-CoA synthetase